MLACTAKPTHNGCIDDHVYCALQHAPCFWDSSNPEILPLQAWLQPNHAIDSAQYVQRELPKRLARRLLDLQLLPYIVVSNPHIKRVYHAYYHAFETLRQLPQVKSLEGNALLCDLLRSLLEEQAPMMDALATGAFQNIIEYVTVFAVAPHASVLLGLGMEPAGHIHANRQVLNLDKSFTWRISVGNSSMHSTVVICKSFVPYFDAMQLSR